MMMMMMMMMMMIMMMMMMMINGLHLGEKRVVIRLIHPQSLRQLCRGCTSTGTSRCGPRKRCIEERVFANTIHQNYRP